MSKILYVSAKYYVNAEILNYDEIVPFETDIGRGLPIDGLPAVEVLALKKPHDIFSCGLWTFVSDTFINTLIELGASDCFQNFKATVKLRNGKIYGCYYVLNVIRKADCFDTVNSIFSQRNGVFYQAKKLEILEGNVNNNDYIFRIAKYTSNILILNQSAVNKFEASRLRGPQLYTFEEWNNSIYV